MNRDNDKGKLLINRSFIMIIAKLVLLLLIILRLYYLQVFQADKYKTLADENRISTRLLLPPRGVIYDRNGVLIASNKQNFQAMIVAEQTPNLQKTLDEFKKIMPLSEEEEAKIKKELRRNKSFVPIKIKDNLTWEEVSKIQLNAPDLQGIYIDEGLSRDYPFSDSMTHILGYVASVSESDAKKDNDPLLQIPEFKIGKSGVEKLFEKDLRGKGGSLKLEVNAYGRVMKEIERIEGISGKSLTLTIDSRLQKTAFDAFGEESGAAVVLDVHSGEILAFVSAPSYNPNSMVKGMGNKEWKSLLNNEKKPLSNKVIAGQYSPGSTFKTIVALAALENEAVKPETKFFCSGQIFVGNHAFHCWKRQGHGHMNITDALMHSCDIYFYEVAQKIGIEKIAEMARRFGLGKKINIGIDNEKDGLIPDKAWKLKRFGEPWQQGETVIAGIGQGYVLTTPLQLATMVSRIANGGYEIQPTFTKVTDKSSIKKINISSSHINAVKQGMFDVVNIPGGTAYMSRFDVDGQQMAGKTGSTQVRRITMKERQTGVLKQEELPWKYRDHALFVAFAPYDNPRYGIAVLVEHGGGGSSVAAPIASKILQEALKLNILD